MIITEPYGTRYDGVALVRTYSDTGYRIIQDGTGRMYDEVIDPEMMGRTYTESTELIEDDISDADALRILMGGDTDAEVPGDEAAEND